MTGTRSLRFASLEAAPAKLRAMLEKQLKIGVTNAIAEVAQKPNKYRNVVTMVDGIRFDSKREARYYEALKLRIAAGEVSYFLRQVPIHLPGGTKLVVDFQVFFVDPLRPCSYDDTKGKQTKEFRIKKREVEHHYPIKINCV